MSEKMERRALYPGSFDPPTNGHKWVMERVSHEFDKGIVAVGYNPEKVGRFPLYEREEMLMEIASEYPNLVIASFHGMYQADFAESLGASVIIRGIRNADYNFENDISQVNRQINPRVETAFRIPPNELQQVSSSMVMGLVGFEGWEEQVKLMVPKTVFDRIERRQKEKERVSLEQKWLSLHRRLKANGNANAQFQDLYQRYEEPHRSYHALPHIRTCLNELELVRNRLDNPDAVELALWFHDAVYESNIQQDPGNQIRRDDEGKSAEYARKVIGKDMWLGREVVDSVEKLILATKHTGVAETADEKYMVDIDLSILGRSARLFDAYERQIREEYHWVDEEIFREKRAEVLSTFLPPYRPNIYHSAFFQDRYEEQARSNLTRSISNLRNT